MARLFDQASSGPGDSINFGSPAALDDLATAGQTLVAAIHRPGATPVDGFIASKQSALTNGWAFLITGALPDTRPRLIVGRATTRTDVQANAAVITTSGVHAFTAATFDAGFSDGLEGVRLYHAALQSLATEVATQALTTGSGAAGADAALDLLVGNWGVANEPYDGDLGFVAIVHKAGATAFTLAEVRQVQAGLLTMLAGRQDADNATTIARGVAMIEAIGDAELIAEIETDGTITDHSANALTGTLTGTDPGTDQANWFAPTEFWNDVQPSDTVHAQEQTIYRYTSGLARSVFTTTATAVDIWSYRTLDALYDEQARVGLTVDGAWSQALDTPNQGYNAGQITGLAGSSKSLGFIGGVRSRPAALTGSDPSEGTFPILYRFNAAATEVAPVTPSKGVVVLSESVCEGFLADPVQQLGVFSRVRLAGDAGINGVTFMGWGGFQIRLEGPDSTGIDNLVAQALQDDPAAVVLAFGVNDLGNGTYTLTQFMDRVEALVDALLAAAWTGKIMLLGPVLRTEGTAEGDGAQGYSNQDIRDGYVTLAAAKGSRVSAHDPGPNADDVLEAGDLSDGVHPTTTGHGKLYDWVAPILVATLSAASVPPGRSTRRAFGRGFGRALHRSMTKINGLWQLDNQIVVPQGA